MRKVLNFGSLNLDYVYQVDHFAAPGETLSAMQQSVKCGGKGLNQSVALAFAGVPVFHAGCLGQGGDRLKEMLKKSGVDLTYLVSVEEIQGNAVIQVNPAGENCILLFGGSNQKINETQITDTLDGFAAGDYLVLQNEVNLLPLMIEKAYQKEMKIVLNPSPFHEKMKEVDFGKVTWLLINEVEAGQITGSRDPKQVWENLHDKYPNLSVVMTMGREGSICYTCGRCFCQEAFPVKALDTTGAGDTYTGYFIAGLIHGFPVEQCMELASAASAISVTKSGAAASIPQMSEVRAFLKERGNAGIW